MLLLGFLNSGSSLLGITFFNSLYNLFSSEDNFLLTSILTITSKSPLTPLFKFVAPPPFNLKTCPLFVPAGIFIFTFFLES